MIALKRRYIISTSVAVVLLAAASWILSKAYTSLHADLLPMLGLTLVGMLLMGAMWFLFAVARRQRAESEALHRAMLEATPDLMFRLSETGEYLDFHATDAARSRLATGTRVGATVKDALPPAVAEQWLDAIQGALRSGSAQSLELSSRCYRVYAISKPALSPSALIRLSLSSATSASAFKRRRRCGKASGSSVRFSTKPSS